MEADEVITSRLAALAHPVRLAMVRQLVRAGPEGLPAGRLGQALGLAPNSVTFHVQKLAGVGLVSRRRQGRFVLYRAEFEALFSVTDSLVGACCAESREKCGTRCASATGG